MSTWSRRHFLTSTAALITTAAASPRLVSAQSTATRPAATSPYGVDESAYAWHDVRDWGIEGKGFSDVASHYDRLPARAKGVVRPSVWDLSRNSTGLSVSFRATTPAVAVRYTLTSDRLDMPHMPATGVSGVDLYGKDPSERLRFLGCTRPASLRVAGTLAANMDPVSRDYRLYFPLYNGVKQLEVGLPKDTTDFGPFAPRLDPPVVYYGTSIAQGGCVSRPGMAFTNILSRWLDRPFINLSFSGNGQMEASVAQFLVELEPAAYVIDCLPNMNPPMVRERAVPLVKQLREKRPNVPILLVEDRTHDGQWASRKDMAVRDDRRKALREAFDQISKEVSQPKLHYLKGDALTGADGEGTVDGSHPTDLGSMRYAEQLAPAIKALLSA